MIKKDWVIVSVIVVIVGATAGAFGFYIRDVVFPQKRNVTETIEKESVVVQKKDTVTVGSDWVSLKKQIDDAYPGAEHIERGDVAWHDPVDLGDLGWTSKEMYAGFSGTKDMKSISDGAVSTFASGGIKYVEVGKIIQGKYSGSTIVAFLTLAGFDMPRDTVIYYAIVGTSEKRILLGMTESDWRENTKSELSAYVSGATFDTQMVIDELVVYPKEIRGRTEREIFQRDDYAKVFFLSTEKLTKVFSDSVLGQVWRGEARAEYPETAQDTLARTLNNFSYFDVDKKRVPYQIGDVIENGFYLRRPDGTAVTYRQKFDIFDTFDRVGVLRAVWNDGTKNTEQYEEYPSGCGMVSYVYDVTDTISIEKDLVVVGKTEQGDILYGYKDVTHPEFQRLYNEIYWVEAGQKKTSPEEFLTMHPEVFWQNSFGRTLAFYNTKFISPAECGKPVIYLYPEKTTNVSVKVFPSGFTKTDPEYGDGWSVTARPSGTLTNKADGRTYPYLFWEGYSDVLYQKSDLGFVVAQENLKLFLDEKLSKLGLIDKEIADFEEFWLPKMQEEKKPYYFVTFLSKSKIDTLAPLRIDPKPDTVIRVMMDYRGLDVKEVVVPQTLITPKREGFTVVEWGGMLRK